MSVSDLLAVLVSAVNSLGLTDWIVVALVSLTVVFLLRRLLLLPYGDEHKHWD